MKESVYFLNLEKKAMGWRRKVVCRNLDQPSKQKTYFLPCYQILSWCSLPHIHKCFAGVHHKIPKPLSLGTKYFSNLMLCGAQSSNVRYKHKNVTADLSPRPKTRFKWKSRSLLATVGKEKHFGLDKVWLFLWPHICKRLRSTEKIPVRTKFNKTKSFWNTAGTV